MPTAIRALFALIALTLLPAALQAQPDPTRYWHAPPPGPRPTAVVLDFPQAPRADEYRDECRRLGYVEKEVVTEKDRRGFWFNAQNVYTNSNAGKIMADIMATALDEGCVFNIRSRADVKLYYADKRDVLTARLKLSDKELDKAILKLNPVMIGREMGVDKVVIGYVVDSELRHSRAFGPFCAVASVNVSIYDTKTGHVEWTCDFHNYRANSTSYGNLEEIAQEFTERLRAFYGGGRWGRSTVIQARR